MGGDAADEVAPERHTAALRIVYTFTGRVDVVLHITPLERTALQLLAGGAETRTLADRLGLNERAVEAQLASLFSRLGVANLAEALAVAARRGLLTTLEPH
jgi:DNA-binding CsgD family transcriptional regulator